MSYDQPDKASKFTPSDNMHWLGKLFLFWPESVETVNFNRADGTVDPTEMVTADVAIIDLPDPEEQGKPTFLEGARIGGSALAPQLKKKIGKKVLGRLAQSPRVGNKSGAFFLADFTPADVALAEQYEAAFPHVAYQPGSGNGQSQFPAQSWGGAQPAATPPAAAQPVNGAAWGAQPAAAAAAPPAWGAAAPPAPAAPAAPPWAPGLREFLTARGIATETLDEATARQIAATLPQ